MGNEQSVSEEPTQTEKNPEKLGNGSVNGSVNGLSEISAVGAETTLEKNGSSLLLSLATEPNGTNQVTDEGDGERRDQGEEEEHDEEHVDAPDFNEVSEKAVKQEEVKKSKGKKGNRFGKLFNIKPHLKNVPQEESSGESPAGLSPPEAEAQQDSGHLSPEPRASPQPQSASAQPTPEEEAAPETEEQPEDEEEGQPEQNAVMNFFKTLVTPTKPTKKGSAAPDAPKDQSEKESQPAATPTVAQVSEPPAAPKGMSVPPPPPPEPPKMETKGETSAKAAKTAPKDEPKAAVKEAEASKGKSAKDAFGKFFRAKTNKEPPQPEAVVQAQADVDVQETAKVEAEPVVEIQQALKEEPQPEGKEEKVDPSKTGTLEAAPKPEPPPPVQEKKAASKSGFMSVFKSKAADTKKASPEVPAAAEPAPPVKTKEEPKPAAKTSETTAESKAAVTAAPTGDDAPSAPKKLEKRNSIQLFFKILGQKRNSTDAGIQTDPLAGPAAAEKSK